MQAIWISLLIFWIIIIVFPEVIAFLIWWFLVFLALNILFLSNKISKDSQNKEEYIKFGKYKIYR